MDPRKTITSSGTEKIPPYVEVYNRLYSDITSGVYPPGARLPGEVELAERYGVGRHTLRQALVILVEDGLVAKHQGSGNYVSDAAPSLDNSARHIANPVMTFARREIDNIDIRHNYGPPTEIAQRRLSISASEIVLAANSVYRSGGDIVAHSFTQITSGFIQSQGVDLNADGQVYALINTSIFEAARSSELSFRVIAADGDVLDTMEILPGTTLVYIEQVLFGPGGEGIARSKYYLQPAEFDIHFSFSVG